MLKWIKSVWLHLCVCVLAVIISLDWEFVSPLHFYVIHENFLSVEKL